MDSNASEHLDPLAFRVGETTVGDNLNKAVAAGRLIAHADGTWEVSERKPSPKRWLSTKVPWHVPCETMLRLIFTNAYDRKQVPWHCRNCYKVKARPRSMRQLLALGRLLKATKWTAKYGLNVASSANQGGYAAYVYLDGLDAARGAYHQLRAQMDASPGVGPDVALQIKRGCTEYEVMCGPSDQYQFAPEQAAVERWLMARFRRSQPRPPSPRRYVLLEWAKFAWQIGDETYRDVVGALHPGRPIVVYDPGPPSAATSDFYIPDTPADN